MQTVSMTVVERASALDELQLRGRSRDMMRPRDCDYRWSGSERMGLERCCCPL
jgi:hypothetical protein